VQLRESAGPPCVKGCVWKVPNRAFLASAGRLASCNAGGLGVAIADKSAATLAPSSPLIPDTFAPEYVPTLGLTLPIWDLAA
jgi:hypothetical protein